jgi:hypothetical protein
MRAARLTGGATPASFRIPEFFPPSSETVLTLSGLQLALLAAGAATGGAIFGMIGFAFGIVLSVFIHHGFAAADVVFIVVGGSIVLNLGVLPRFAKEIRWRAAMPYLAGATLGMPLGLWLLAHPMRVRSGSSWARSSSPTGSSPCASSRASLSASPARTEGQSIPASASWAA